MIAMEGVILFKQNKTGEWLKSKSDVEKKHIRNMYQARAGATPSVPTEETRNFGAL